MEGCLTTYACEDTRSVKENITLQRLRSLPGWTLSKAWKTFEFFWANLLWTICQKRINVEGCVHYAELPDDPDSMIADQAEDNAELA
eukprot:3335891-Amphidinium_carterae.1